MNVESAKLLRELARVTQWELRTDSLWYNLLLVKWNRGEGEFHLWSIHEMEMKWILNSKIYLFYGEKIVYMRVGGMWEREIAYFQSTNEISWDFFTRFSFFLLAKWKIVIKQSTCQSRNYLNATSIGEKNENTRNFQFSLFFLLQNRERRVRWDFAKSRDRGRNESWPSTQIVRQA